MAGGGSFRGRSVAVVTRDEYSKPSRLIQDMAHSKWQDLPTEAINPETLGIDKMSSLDIIDLIGSEDRRVVAAVHKERERIAHGVDLIVAALKKSGRLFLVGAGTSGRLGLLEAAGMPLASGASPKVAQAGIA